MPLLMVPPMVIVLFTFRHRPIAYLLLLALLVSACAQANSERTAEVPRPRGSPSPLNTSHPTAQNQATPTALPTQRLSPVSTTVAASTPEPMMVDTDGLPLPDVAALRQVILEAINGDRAAHGLSEVAWDETAARAGQAHAEEMASAGYFSHRDLSGHGPDYRYVQAGGQDVVMENIYTYWYRYDDGRPAPIEDWPRMIREAEASLMQSPGHRKNILDPVHTHVGVGIAYNADTGEMKLAQEFVNRYVALQALPASVPPGSEVMLQGELLSNASEPLINLAYEPFPQQKVASELKPGTFVSPADIYWATVPETNGSYFESAFPLDYDGRSGLYHVRVWVQVGGERLPAVDAMVAVTAR